MTSALIMNEFHWLNYSRANSRSTKNLSVLLLYLCSPWILPPPPLRARVAGGCDDYFSVHGSSLKLMSCKNSIIALLLFSLFPPNILFTLYFYQPLSQPNLSYLNFPCYLFHFSCPLIALFSSSFFLFLDSSLILPSALSDVQTHTHTQVPTGLTALLNTQVNLIRCC